MTTNVLAAAGAAFDEQARRAPAAYRRKVLLLGLLGSGYIYAVVALLVLVLAAVLVTTPKTGALGVKLTLVVGALLVAVVRALWVHVPEPQGMEVTRDQAPELFAMIDDVSRQVGAPRVHRVLVDEDLNAGIVQSPRLGVLGWPRNHLLLGLPLLRSLSVEQFRAVLAHEMAHLAGGHGRWANWIYRQRRRWATLMATLEERKGFGRFLFMPFLRRFVPFFQSYSFPLARQNEYEADAAAARVASAAAAAQALTNVDVVARFLSEDFWPGVYRQAELQPAPTTAPMAVFAPGAALQPSAESAARWLAAATSEQTGQHDTHPCLSDRLAALGTGLQLALPEPDRSAARLLGAAEAVAVQRLDSAWLARVESGWKERYEATQKGLRRLAELDALAAAGELPVDQALERATLHSQLRRDDEAAIAQLRVLAARAPDSAAVCFHLGLRLVERDDPEGIAFLQRSMDAAPDAVAPACEAIRDHFARIGQREQAEDWHERLVADVARRARLERESTTVRTSDKFRPHGLDAGALQALKERLHRVPGLHRAWLVQRLASDGTPLLILGYSVTPWYRLHSAQREQEVLHELQHEVEYPGTTVMICVDGDGASFRRKFSWRRGSRVR